MKKYEKPELNFVSLRNEEKIANTCWGYHGTGTNLYCDIGGTGFVSFQIAEGPCALNVINVQYYGKDTNNNNKIDANDVPVPATDAQKTELNDILVKSGGAEGNPFKGEGTIVKPNPDPSWS